ncbi:class I SAM-dependent methyltransferase [Alicyclobacillus sp. ALC3]|uniref:class I SAM-dependent methyltransferase n=1 Tax=Alicyclobacillus sp. ALC3 TaxID=2796143 RepID=UPI0023781100|nr:class I SAM-dependent methyltransferase [Alicyclobacillus sp. ALC3]WDL98799.1 methyltransferase domain-containing protein [Alicyclobacillus sp. ALC3]
MSKYRESGMPSEDIWEGYYEPEVILRQLKVDKRVDTFVDVGCGYGTFLLPASRLVSGTAIGIDIDRGMVESCRKKAIRDGHNNIIAIQGDISDDSTTSILKSYSGSIDYISLFNILHCENPASLLKVTHSLLNSDGMIGVIH